MCGHAADEQAIRFLVKADRPAKKARQQRTERADRNQAALVFHKKLAAEVGIAILDARPRFAVLKNSFRAVVAQSPARTITFCADLAERLQQFEQADIFASLALH